MVSIDIQEWGKECVDIYEEEVSSFQNEEGDVEPREISEYPFNRTLVNILNLGKEIEWIVAYLEDQGTKANELREDLKLVTTEIDELRSVHGREFDETIQNLLEDYYELYPRDVCHMFEFEPIENETPNTMDRRDSLQILWEELTCDDEKMNEGMRVLDEVLKCKYESNKSLVRELNISRTYYPSRYWWRHPDQVLDES